MLQFSVNRTFIHGEVFGQLSTRAARTRDYLHVSDNDCDPTELRCTVLTAQKVKDLPSFQSFGFKILFCQIIVLENSQFFICDELLEFSYQLLAPEMCDNLINKFIKVFLLL